MGLSVGVRVSYLGLLTAEPGNPGGRVSTGAAVNRRLHSHTGGRDRGLRCPPSGQAGGGDCQRDQASRKHLLRAPVCSGPENRPGARPQVLQKTRKTQRGVCSTPRVSVVRVFLPRPLCSPGSPLLPPLAPCAHLASSLQAPGGSCGLWSLPLCSRSQPLGHLALRVGRTPEGITALVHFSEVPPPRTCPRPSWLLRWPWTPTAIRSGSTCHDRGVSGRWAPPKTGPPAASFGMASVVRG